MTAAALPHAKDHTAPNLDCIHCGLCLSVCPTYLQIGSEVDSPRGRIYLMKAVEEGRIAPSSATFEKHMHLCLECRACESACPSGVKFSVMMNDARVAIREARELSRGERFLRRLVFKALLPSRFMLHVNFRLLRFYQRSGIQKLIRASGILRVFPRKLSEMESLLPAVPPAPRYHLPETAAPSSRRKVALFEGCIMPELFGSVHEATVRVLGRNDASVCSPSRQTCCGALHLHDGEKILAQELARKNIDAFEQCGADFVIVNAAGCGAMLKEYGQLLQDDPAYAGRAGAFSQKVKDIAEYLDSIGPDPKMGRLEMRVTYDDPCHLLHGQGIKAAPRNLLKTIPGLEIIELRDADRCCGSAGIYNITHPELAGRILDDKIANIARTGAQVVATGNPGCLLQIGMGLRAKNLSMQVLHPIEILDLAYQAYHSTPGSSPPEGAKDA